MDGEGDATENPDTSATLQEECSNVLTPVSDAGEYAVLYLESSSLAKLREPKWGSHFHLGCSDWENFDLGRSTFLEYSKGSKCPPPP